MISKLLCSVAMLLTLAGSTACGTCDPDTSARGAASATWSLAALDQPTTCAHLGAASVSVLLHRPSGAEVVSTFACTDTRASTSLVAVGAYDATVVLQAADGATIARAHTQAITIHAGQLTQLAPAAFTISDRGKLALAFAALSTSTNCLPRDQGGAGITGSLITVERAAGGCAPVTFVRSRKNTTVGSYTVNCSSPAVTSCIERDETLTVDGMESGPYVVNVAGLIGPIRCWAGDDVVSVPAGASLVKPIQLAPQQASGC